MIKQPTLCVIFLSVFGGSFFVARARVSLCVCAVCMCACLTAVPLRGHIREFEKAPLFFMHVRFSIKSKPLLPCDVCRALSRLWLRYVRVINIQITFFYLFRNSLEPLQIFLAIYCSSQRQREK